ncbi:MAG: hypothetical protein ACREOD_05080, partial [Candidatus Dormibacteria bacterium]
SAPAPSARPSPAARAGQPPAPPRANGNQSAPADLAVARPLADVPSPPAPAAKPPAPGTSAVSASPLPETPPLSPGAAPSPSPAPAQPAEALLWGFDPDAPADGEPSPPAAVPSEPEPQPTAAAPPVVPAESAAPAPVQPAPVEPSPPQDIAPAPPMASDGELSPESLAPEAEPLAAAISGWTVRLSPRTASERGQRLHARQGQLSKLLQEIVKSAEEQRQAVTGKGDARRVLETARRQLPSADGHDPRSQLRSLLEASQIEDAVTLAVRVAETEPGDASAALSCEVGESAQQARHEDLAVLCYTTAVLTDPPCDAACWKLCNLAVERRDPVRAPIWLEFIARLLHARGADVDAISVYRQLLRLAPRRTDVRELLRISSLTGVLPD